MAIRGRGRVYTVNSPLWSENNTFLPRNNTRPHFQAIETRLRHSICILVPKGPRAQAALAVKISSHVALYQQRAVYLRR